MRGDDARTCSWATGDSPLGDARDDFQTLLGDLGFPSDPFARPE